MFLGRKSSEFHCIGKSHVCVLHEEPNGLFEETIGVGSVLWHLESLGCIFLFLKRILFCEIQESVGFLRNPQDFKNSSRKMKKMFLFLMLKNGSVLTP